MNLLHTEKALGQNNTVNIIIEIPSGTQAKIEYDKDKETFVVDRVINPKISFPFNYGFIPETWSNDNDPLDALVISSDSISTGTKVESRIIGFLSTTDQDGQDSKIIAIPIAEKNPHISKISGVESLDIQTQNDIQYFYKNYKMNEPGKWVDVNGFYSKDKAGALLTEAIDRYHQHFQK
jgi:inorganic pyrophosphatase